MAKAYELITSYTLTSTSTGVDFNSIPNTYEDLLLKASARTNRGAATDDLLVYFNSDTNDANYYFKGLYCYTAGSVQGLQGAAAYGGAAVGNTATSSIFSNTEVYIPNYLSSSYKNMSIDGVNENNGPTVLALYATIWNNTAAVTKITVKGNNGSLLSDTTLSLYGIKNS